MSEMQQQPGTDHGQEPSSAPPPGGVSTSETAPPDGGVSVSGDKKPNGSLATGAESTPEPDPVPVWTEDWREKMAEVASAGDQKAYAKELKRLEKFATPADVFTAYRAIENTWSSRNFVKLPGKDAKPEEIAEYNKAMGVPDTPEDYLKNIQLPDGMVLGDWDMPAAKSFAEVAHKVGAPPSVVAATIGWYLKTQEEQAAALDESDDSFKRTAEQALKNEYGNGYRRYMNNISTLFSAAPGGADINNENSVYARLLGGRTADGKIIGDDPDVTRFLVNLANNLNPAGTVVEDADPSGKSIDTEIAEIEKVMRTDRRKYDKELAPRYQELIAARDKIRANKSR